MKNKNKNVNKNLKTSVVKKLRAFLKNNGRFLNNCCSYFVGKDISPNNLLLFLPEWDY